MTKNVTAPSDHSVPSVPAEPRKAGRRPGRPTGAQHGEPRALLLDVALVLFARQGIMETTLGAIAREAGVTPAMVHYYFKTRDQLLDVLIDERFVPLRAELGRAFADSDAEPADALRAFAEGLVAVAERHPWFATLWVREVISEGGCCASVLPSVSAMRIRRHRLHASRNGRRRASSTRTWSHRSCLCRCSD